MAEHPSACKASQKTASGPSPQLYLCPLLDVQTLYCSLINFPCPSSPPMVSCTSIKLSCVKLPETEQERQVLAGFWCMAYIHTALCRCSRHLFIYCSLFWQVFLSTSFFWTLHLHLGLLKGKRGARHGALSRSRSSPQKESSKTDSCAFLH